MAEIRPAPVEVGSLSQLFTLGFSTIPGGDRRISEPSTVLPSHSNGISPIHNRKYTFNPGPFSIAMLDDPGV